MKKRLGILMVSVLVLLSACAEKENASSETKEKDDKKVEYGIDASEVCVGEYVIYGTYEQDNDTTDAEPIEWRVLTIEDGKALLVSKYALTGKPYHTTYEDVTWEDCTLRDWLNKEFYQEAFSKKERKGIVKTKIENKDNAEYGTKGGNDTEDSVFLLSTEEAKAYFAEDIEFDYDWTENVDRGAVATAYAIAQGVYTNDDEEQYLGNCCWWLRDMGYTQKMAVCVEDEGGMWKEGCYVIGVENESDIEDGDTTNLVGVRPAIWVNIIGKTDTDEKEEIAEEGEILQEQPTESITDAELKKVTINLEKSISESYYESAIISGITEDGKVVWQYQTGEYPVAQLDSVEEIGLYNDMYYFCEGGAIVTLNLQNGEIIWKNEEFIGAGVCYDFDEQGNLYIAGYFGPDLMVVDVNGRTVNRYSVFNDEKFIWPYKLDYTNDYVFITYEHYDDWMWEDRPFWENGEEASYGGYTMSYSLRDGSFDTEHNALEPEPKYHCYYQENQGQRLQIDYLGEGAYLVNVYVESSVCASNMIGYLDGDNISFRGSNDIYDYEGVVYRYQDGIAVVFYGTNNSQLVLGKKYLFGVEEDSTEQEVPQTLTSEELMKRVSGISASSSLSENGKTHEPHYIFDGDLETGWVEGVSGQGIGEGLTITLNQESLVNGFVISAGYHKSDSLYEKNSRPKQIKVLFSDGTEESFVLNDIKEAQQIAFGTPRKVTNISIVIEEVYPGSKYEDAVISELVLY